MGKILAAATTIALALSLGFVFGSSRHLAEKSSMSNGQRAEDASTSRIEARADDQLADLAENLAAANAARLSAERRAEAAERDSNATKANAKRKLKYHSCFRHAVIANTDVALAGFAASIKPTGLKGMLKISGKQIVGFFPIAGDMLAGAASYYEGRVIETKLKETRDQILAARVRADARCRPAVR